MTRNSLAYELFSGVCLTLLGLSCLVFNLAELANPWRIGVSVFILLGAFSYFFSAYRRLR